MTNRPNPAMDSIQTAPEQISRLMEGLRHGSKDAAGQLVAIFYPELRRMARACMKREPTPHTWQPTVLVNELFLKLVKIKALNPGHGGRTDREMFLGLAAHIMKRMLIDHARPLKRRVEQVDLCEGMNLETLQAGSLTDLDDLLVRLSGIDPQLRMIVELRVFEDLSIREIADQLGCAPRTVDRRWFFARNWLQQQFAGDMPEAL
jgi:RNA polymerase sigma factor (TIGR02999 family)